MTNILPIIHLFFFAVQQFDYLVLDLNQELCQLGPAFLIKAEYQYLCLQTEKSILRTCVLHPKGNCLKTDWRVLPQTLGRFHNNKPKEEEAATCNRVQSLKSAIHEHKDACACVCVCVVGYPTVAMKYPYTYSRVPKLGKQRGKRENTSNYKHKRVWEEHKETQQLETLWQMKKKKRKTKRREDQLSF